MEGRTTVTGVRYAERTDMASSPSHLVCLFLVTSGQNGESLGSDEEQIVVFAYALYDIANNKVNAND